MRLLKIKVKNYQLNARAPLGIGVPSLDRPVGEQPVRLRTGL
jgi:hypothetical protein